MIPQTQISCEDSKIPEPGIMEQGRCTRQRTPYSSSCQLSVARLQRKIYRTLPFSLIANCQLRIASLFLTIFRQNPIRMKSIIHKLTHLWKKKPKPRSKAGYWLLPIGIFAAAGVAYLLTESQLFTPQAAKIIPARNLAMYADVGHPECNAQLEERAPNLCEQRDIFLTSVIGDFPQRLSLFADRIVLVAYSDLGANDTFAPTVMFRIANEAAAENYLKKRPGAETAIEETWEDMRILRYQEPVSRTVFFWRGWLISTPADDFHKRVAEVEQQVTPAATNDAFWQGLVSKLDGSDSAILFKSQLLKNRLPVGAQPLLDFIPQIGLGFAYDENGVSLTLTSNTLNTFFTQKSVVTKDSLIDPFPAREADMTALLAQPQAEIEWAMEYLDKTDPAFAYYLRGQIRTFLQDIFGNDISLENDILPLFENQVALALFPKNGAGYDFLVALDTDDALFAAAKKEKLLAALQTAAATFVPRILEHVLEDGTVIREVAACEDCIQISEESVGDATYSLFTSEDDSGASRSLTLGLIEDIFVIASATVDIESFLTRFQDSQSANPHSEMKLGEYISMKPEIVSMFFPQLAKNLDGFTKITFAQNSDSEFFHLVINAAFAE